MDKRSQSQSSVTGHAKSQQQRSPAEVLEVNEKRTLRPVVSSEPALGSPSSRALRPFACDRAHESHSRISPALEGSVDILDNFIGQQLLQVNSHPATHLNGMLVVSAISFVCPDALLLLFGRRQGQKRVAL